MPYIPIVLLFLIWPLYNSNLLSSESFFMRIDHWVNNISMKFNWFFGGAIGKVGGAARGEGVIATIDSYWFLILMSTGVLGISLIIIYLYEKSLGNQQLKIILIGFFFACFFVTITQSMSFLVLFPLLFLKNPDILPNDYKHLL